MPEEIATQLAEMRRYFKSGATQSYAFRKQQLLALQKAVIAHEAEIYTALKSAG